MTTTFEPTAWAVGHRRRPSTGAPRRSSSPGGRPSAVRTPGRRRSRDEGVVASGWVSASGWVGVATWALATATGFVLRDEVPPDV